MGPGLSLNSVQMCLRQLLEADLGAGPQLGHDLAGAEGSKLTTALEGFALGEAMQESAGIEVACSRGVHQVSQAEDADIPALVSAQYNGSLGTTGDSNHRAAASHPLEDFFEIISFIKRLNFDVIGEQHIDVAIHQFKKTRSMPIHTEAIGERKSYLSACIAAGFGGCLLYTSPSPRDGLLSRMPSSA